MKDFTWLSLSLATFSCLISHTAKAQITPDNSLGEENSVVTPLDEQGFAVDQIDGGATRGESLFHSFQDFNVDVARDAYFSNPDGINNIFSRVTGINPSNINGLLGVLGNANLFLINPNGIIFGQNARLDLNGSFFASTADSLLFEGDTEFSAVNPQAAPLLEVSIPIGARFRDNPGDITNLSVNNGFGLGVVPENNITFIGGDILFERGQVTANGGNVRLGGLSEAGTVGINQDSSLSFPEDTAKSDISFTNAADVDVRGAGGGNININARNLSLEAGESSNSGLVAGIPLGIITNNSQVGDIVIDVTDSINIDNSVIINQVFPGAEGDAGNVSINTDSLQLTNGGVINASTQGQGNGGLVDINATNNISISGEDQDSNPSNIASVVNVGAVGNAGDVSINTKTLELIDGGGIGSNLLGEGEGGLVQITANDRIIIDSQNSVRNISGISNIVGSQATGNSGSIEIKTNSLELTNGGEIVANTFGLGDAGQIDITATNNIKIDSGNSANPSNIGSIVTFSGIGNAGLININTNSLELTNGGGIGSFTSGTGNAGSINIEAEKNILLDGVNPFEAEIRSQLTSSVGGQGQGNAGNITVNTNFLSLMNSASISVGFFGTREDSATAEGGNIEVNTSNLSLANNSQIIASTSGLGDSGEIAVNATETIIIEDSSVSNRVNQNAVGDGGQIDIDTNNLSIINGGVISASTFGNGDSGTVEINASESVTIQGRSQSMLINDDISRGVRSRIASSVQNNAIGEGGDINITTTNLSISNDATISAGTLGRGNAGNIVINASESVSVDGLNTFGEDLPSTIINTSEEGAIGNAGGIDITTANFSLINNGQVDVSSFGDGNGGDVVIQADRATLNSGRVSATNTPSQPVSSEVLRIGGNVNFAIAEDIILRNNSQISAEARENATGGNVTINADNGFILAFSNQNNDIVASAEDGRGGEINIDTQAIFGLQERSNSPLTNDIDATSGVDGLDGTVDINNPAVDPTTGLINLPASVGDASDQISQNPCQQGVGSQFVVTGKGGLPPNVSEATNGESAQVGLVEPLLGQKKEATRGQGDTIQTDNQTTEAFRKSKAVPAMGWVFNDKGEVTLTAYSNTDTSRERSLSNSTTCNANIAP